MEITENRLIRNDLSIYSFIISYKKEIGFISVINSPLFIYKYSYILYCSTNSNIIFKCSFLSILRKSFNRTDIF